MKINWNPDHVTPPGIVQFGEHGIVIVRGVVEANQKAVEAVLAELERDTPGEFTEAAIATGKFTASEWGVHPAIEFLAPIVGEVAGEPAPKKKGKKAASDE